MAKITTITNPLTGQPAQVDQLDHTAQQIDDGLNIARGVSNPNLLDNWYFGNPVDQRQGRVVVPNTTYYSDNTLATAAGTTSAYVTAYRYATGTVNGVNYASFKLTDSDTAPTYYAAPENVVRGYTGAGYGIDRWLLKQGTMLIEDDHIVFKSGANNASAGQVIDNPNRFSGKVVTLSVLGRREKNDGYFAVRNNNTYFGVNLHLGAELNVYSITFTCKDDLTDFYIQYTSWTTDEISHIYAIKLELGSQQTLAHQENGVWVLNEIPDYGEQLARCQRYQIRMKVRLPKGSQEWVDFPTTMRTTPSIEIISSEGSFTTAMHESPDGVIADNTDTKWSRTLEFIANANL